MCLPASSAKRKVIPGSAAVKLSICQANREGDGERDRYRKRVRKSGQWSQADTKSTKWNFLIAFLPTVAEDYWQMAKRFISLENCSGKALALVQAGGREREREWGRGKDNGNLYSKCATRHFALAKGYWIRAEQRQPRRGKAGPGRGMKARGGQRLLMLMSSEETEL